MREQPEGLKEDRAVVYLPEAAVPVPLGAAGVVVSHHQPDLSLQGSQNLGGFFLAIEGEIPQQIDGVLRGDRFVPAADQLPVHLLHRGKGPVLVANDVGMAEVGVGREINSGHWAHLPGWNTFILTQPQGTGKGGLSHCCMTFLICYGIIIV